MDEQPRERAVMLKRGGLGAAEDARRSICRRDGVKTLATDAIRRENGSTDDPGLDRRAHRPPGRGPRATPANMFTLPQEPEQILAPDWRR
jgi:hypothetical protein